jgi:hypothetical protein
MSRVAGAFEVAIRRPPRFAKPADRLGPLEARRDAGDDAAPAVLRHTERLARRMVRTECCLVHRGFASLILLTDAIQTTCLPVLAARANVRA